MRKPTNPESSSVQLELPGLVPNQILELAGLCEEDRVDLGELEEYMRSSELHYGERFSLIEASWANKNVAVAKIKISSELREESVDYVIHPCIIDACTQATFAIQLKKTTTGSPPPILPIGEPVLFIPYIFIYAQIFK